MESLVDHLANLGLMKSAAIVIKHYSAFWPQFGNLHGLESSLEIGNASGRELCCNLFGLCFQRCLDCHWCAVDLHDQICPKDCLVSFLNPLPFDLVGLSRCWRDHLGQLGITLPFQSLILILPKSYFS